MNDDTRNNTNNRPVYLNNYTTPDATVFDWSTPTAAAATAACTIVPDAHISPSGENITPSHFSNEHY